MYAVNVLGVFVQLGQELPFTQLEHEKAAPARDAWRIAARSSFTGRNPLQICRSALTGIYTPNFFFDFGAVRGL